MDHSVQSLLDHLLAGASTLNRLELSSNKESRAHKIGHDPEKIQACLLEMGARCLFKHTREVVLDLEAMGHQIHGAQEGRHFNGYYDNYCHPPLYAFVGEIPFWAQLRTCEKSAVDGTVPALEKIAAAIRKFQGFAQHSMMNPYVKRKWFAVLSFRF